MNSILKTLSNWCIGFAVIYWPVCIMILRYLDVRNLLYFSSRFPRSFLVGCICYHIAVPIIFTFLAIVLRKINDTMFAEKMFLFRQLEDIKKALDAKDSDKA